MKRFISVFCVIATLFMILSLSACGGQKLDGTYQLMEMVSGEEDMSSVLDAVSVLMTIEDDHAALDLMGQTIEWEIDTKTSVMRTEDGAEAPYRVEGSQIILENRENGVNMKMVFEKVDSTPDSK